MKNVDLVQLKKNDLKMYNDLFFSVVYCSVSHPVISICSLYGVLPDRCREWLVKVSRSCLSAYGLNAVKLGYLPESFDIPYTSTEVITFFRVHERFFTYCVFKMKRETGFRLVSPDTFYSLRKC